MTGTPQNPNDQPPASPRGLAFHYIKSNFFRVVHVDGAVGGVGPSGSIVMSVFNERMPIPLRVVHEVDASGRLGAVIESAQRDGLVREVEVELVFNRDVAIAVNDWLTQQIQKLDVPGQADGQNKP